MDKHTIYNGSIFPSGLWKGRQKLSFMTDLFEGEIDALVYDWFHYLVDLDTVFDARSRTLISRYTGDRKLGVDFGLVLRDACDEGLISVIQPRPKTFAAFSPDEGYLISPMGGALVKMSHESHIENLLRRGFPLPPGYEHVQRFHDAWRKAT